MKQREFKQTALNALTQWAPRPPPAIWTG